MELKSCPVCGKPAQINTELASRAMASCSNPFCFMYGAGFHLEDWEKPRFYETEVARLREEIHSYDEHRQHVLNEACADISLHHCTCVPDLRLEIARLLETARWIPVSERLPEKGEGNCSVWVLATDKSDVFSAFYDYEEKRWVYDSFLVEYVITHWRPLPKFPEVE